MLYHLEILDPVTGLKFIPTRALTLRRALDVFKRFDNHNLIFYWHLIK